MNIKAVYFLIVMLWKYFLDPETDFQTIFLFVHLDFLRKSDWKSGLSTLNTHFTLRDQQLDKK